MKGKRGICPSLRAARYDWKHFDQYVAWNNTEILLVPMIEQVEALDNIDAICALDDVKMLVFAAGDLAYAMGEASRMMDSPLVRDAYRKVLDSAKRHNVGRHRRPCTRPDTGRVSQAIQAGGHHHVFGTGYHGFSPCV